MKNRFGNNEDAGLIKLIRSGFVELMNESSGFEMIDASCADPLQIDAYSLSSSATNYDGYMHPSVDLAWEVYYKLAVGLRGNA